MPKTHRTVACLMVRSSRAFVWLGHMPIINWSLRRLLDVRGIDKIVCVSDSRLKTQASKLLAKDEIETVSIPAQMASKTERELDGWISSATGPAADADVVLILKPTSPFLPAAKIEAVISAVAGKKADLCCTIKEVSAFVRMSPRNPEAPISRLSAYAEIGTCRAFAPARLGTQPNVQANRFAPIPVDLVESLDVSLPDNLRVASALVAAGTV